MNDMEQDSGRFKQPVMMAAMVAAAGLGAALVIITLPLVYLENVIGATGLSEFVPAAAPPLGNTARGLIAGLACLVSASAVYYLLNRKGSSEMGVALREKINAANSDQPDNQSLTIARKRRFGLPKFDPRSLTRFLKKPKNNNARVMDLADLPQLRKIGDDADTPARIPLFAETEEVPADPLTGDSQPLEDAAPAMEMPVNPYLTEEILDEEMAVEEMAAEEMPAEMLAADDVQAEEMLAEEALAEETPIHESPADDLADLTIAQLADRLEAGLKRLKQLETANIAPRSEPSAPTEEPPIAAPAGEAPTMAQPLFDQDDAPQGNMAAARHADMDAALKAALGTLEKMSAQR